MNALLESTRLRFRPCAITDVARLVEHWSHPAVCRYLFDDRATNTEEVTGFIELSESNFVQSGFGLWVATDRETGDFRGVCGFMDKDGTPDLLFSVEPEHWGQGLATECAVRVVAYVQRELGIRHVVASVDKPNANSIRVLEKLGMRCVGEQRTLLIYSLETKA